jgi:Pyruvate/2-oxoacid:ferredoxin oxidoreductase gamma subunit
LSVSTQKLKYPTIDEVEAIVKKSAERFLSVDAGKIAEESGVPMSSNIVMVGALAGTGITGLSRKHFEKAIEMNIPRWVPENRNAFARGFEIASSQIGP